VKPYRFHPAAAEEYAAAAEYYKLIDPMLGKRFVQEIETLISEARRSPLLYRKIEGDLRRHLAKSFPFALIYQDLSEVLWIVAVMPLKRHPEYWRQRQDGMNE
jgi:hypothetical protein